MKQCPRCKEVYSDETLNFCLRDGSILTSVQDNSEATLVLPKYERNLLSNSKIPIYILCTLLTVSIAIALALWLKSDNQNRSLENVNLNQSIQNSKSLVTLTPQANSSTTSEQKIVFSKEFEGIINYREIISAKLDRNGQFLLGKIDNKTTKVSNIPVEG